MQSYSFKLNVEFWVSDVWSDVYYNKMILGQYDLGFGSFIITVVSTAEIVAKYAGGVGFDVYYSESVAGGEPELNYDSIYCEFIVAD